MTPGKCVAFSRVGELGADGKNRCSETLNKADGMFPFIKGLVTNLLQKSFNKFFNRHGLIVVKYGATLREMRLAIQA